MKAKTIFFVIIMLTVSRLAYAQYRIQFDSEADRGLHLGGDTLRGNFATWDEANAYWKKRPQFEQNHSWIVPPKTSSSGSGGYSGDSGGNTASEAGQETTNKENQEAFLIGKTNLMIGLKGGTATEVPGLKTGTTALPVIGSGNSQSIGLKPYAATAPEAAALLLEGAQLRTELQAHLDASKEFNDDEAAAVDRTTVPAADRIKKLREECARLEKQLELDTRVMRQYQETNEKGYREIEEWAKASEEAQMDALKAGANLLMSGTVDCLEKQANSARGFKGWLTRYDKEIRQKGIPVEALQPKIERALNGYVGAAESAKAGRLMNKGLTAKDTWDMVRNEVGAVAEVQKDSDAAIADVLKNPELKRFIETNRAGLEFAHSLLDMMAHSKELEKAIGPTAALLDFAANYGYDAKKWWESRCRILEQSKLIEKSLQNFYVLKKQQETTVRNLKASRARLAIEEGK